ncbi:MAG: hypothetical protein WC847_03365 [Candidatus Paceibacterota bacterium]
MMAIIFKILFFLFVLPYIMAERAYEMLKEYFAKKGIELNWMYVTLFILIILLIILLLSGYR